MQPPDILNIHNFDKICIMFCVVLIQSTLKDIHLDIGL